MAERGDRHNCIHRMQDGGLEEADRCSIRIYVIGRMAYGVWSGVEASMREVAKVLTDDEACEDARSNSPLTHCLSPVVSNDWSESSQCECHAGR